MLLFSETMSEPDRSFMEAFYTQYRVLLYSIALRYTEQKETAEDLVQDALIQLMRHVDTLQTLSENARVMYGVCTLKSVACNWLRRNKRIVPWNTSMEESEPEEGALDPTPEELFLLKERRQELLARFYTMREADQQLLVGKYILHKSDAELAQMFGCKAASIRVKLARARHRARKELRGGGGYPALSGENRQQLLENYEDALFALLMDDFAEREGEKLKAENERLKQDPAAQPPEELDQKCRRGSSGRNMQRRSGSSWPILREAFFPRPLHGSRWRRRSFPCYASPLMQRFPLCGGRL